MTEPLQITITGDTEPVREAKANAGTVEVLPLFQAPQTIRGQLAMPEPEPEFHPLSAETVAQLRANGWTDEKIAGAARRKTERS